VYDVSLVLLLFSIFFLSLFRLRLESKQREDVYRRYINAATASAPPAQDDERKVPPRTLTDPAWEYWSARLEDGLELTHVTEEGCSLCLE
jgi:transposase InsO family protein